ncbi:hypothetical protein RCL1_000479 [Eukaryota sp. TZLM3-RCL]
MPPEVFLKSHLSASRINKVSINSKTDVIKTRPKNRCTACKLEGHNRARCPQLKQQTEDVSAAQADLQLVTELLPLKKAVSSEDLPSTVETAIGKSSINHVSCCNCDSSSEILSLGKEKSICFDCAFTDTLRHPIKIPVQVSPRASIPLSVAFRSFSLPLTNGKWDIKHLWKFILLKDSKSTDNSTFKIKYTTSKKPNQSKLVPSNEDSLNQLKALHPVESFYLTTSDSLTYWSNNSVTNTELLKMILHLPSGKAPGPSGISFDVLKSVVRQCNFIVDALVSFYNNMLSGRIIPPCQLTASRLIALKKPNSKIRPIAVGKSLYRQLAP